MRPPIVTLAVAALALCCGPVRADETRSGPACHEVAEVLGITPVPAVADTRDADSAPVYALKYRRCGRTHRLLIRLPPEQAGGGSSPFRPIFF